MDFPILPILVMGFVVGLDTTAAFQVMVSQPLVACTICGWMMGDPVMGALVGVVTQCLWMGKLPVGAATFPDGNMGSLVAAGLVIYLRNTMTPHGIGVLLALSVLWGMLVAGVGGWVIVLTRKVQTRWVPWFEKRARDRELSRYSRGFFLSVLCNGLVGAVTALIWFALGVGLLKTVIPLLPQQIHRIGFLVPYLLLGIGLVQILILFRFQRWWLILGGLAAGLLLWGVSWL
jgi:PTS system mannose-specific IIC component